MLKMEILDLCRQYNNVCIIGMAKNVGKTTVLNHIINKARGKISLGLTSIGRDGEDKDRVTSTEKPKIYVERGTCIATAKQLLLSSDITKEILTTTGMHTPMGEVVIARALSDGYVELGGPSINSHMRKICSELKNLGSSLVLVDGALSRKTSASPSITEAAILSTGASLSGSIDKAINLTKHTVKLLSLEPEKDPEILMLSKEILKDLRVGIIYRDKTVKKLNSLTSLEASKEIVENLNKDSTHIFIKGILSDKLLEDIMKSTDKFNATTLLVEDGTKLFLNVDTLYKFEKQGGNIKVINKINLVCLTVNPKSPSGYEFNKNEFLEKLQASVHIPVIDVLGGE
jgi:hypothetical protein